MKTYQETIDKFSGQLPSWFDEDYYKGVVYHLEYLKNTSKTKKITEAYAFLVACIDDLKKKDEPMRKKMALDIVKFVGDFKPQANVKKHPVESEETIEVKRFCFPLIIQVKCPTCGTLCNHDFSWNYLSYPKLNAPETISVCCISETCNGDCFDVNVTLRITLEVDESSIEAQA